MKNVEHADRQGVRDQHARTSIARKQREIDTDINLDGLVANEETDATSTTSRRCAASARQFEFPQLNKPGVYVIDFIGNGKQQPGADPQGQAAATSSAPSAAGQVFTDPRRARTSRSPNATLWLGGHEYTADKDGQIAVPFSTQPGRQPIVLAQAATSASLDHFQQRSGKLLADGRHLRRSRSSCSRARRRSC